MGVICEPPRRGLVVEIYVNAGIKVMRRTMNFGLWDTSSGIWERAYQLTVADANSPTHKERGVQWFGSHQHFGEVAEKMNHLDTATFEECLKLFCATVNLYIEDGPIKDPLKFELTS